MQIHTSIANFKKLANAVVTQGTFDGVHAGHQKILSDLKEKATELNGESVVLTFFPHPRMVLFPDDESIKLINTLDENIELFRQTGIQHLIVLEFTKEISQLSAVHFVRDILVNAIGTKHLIVGYDHRFGHHREGNFDNLQEFASTYNFTIEKISEVDINNITVSSTKIRKALLAGDVKTAQKYMIHPFTIKGEVMEGNKIGRKIGFPTANIKIKEPYKIVPADGVYAVRIKHLDAHYNGMLNIGKRPTVDGTNRVIEVNIFNFDADIYGEQLCISFIDRIRDEQKFPSLDELKKQLFLDRKKSEEILNYKG